MIYAMIVQMAAVPLRGACKYFQSVADMKKKANVKDIRLSAMFGDFLTNFWLLKLPYEKRADHGIAHFHGVLVKDKGGISGRIEMIE